MSAWPEGLPVAQVRIARPTDNLEACVAFYHEGLGLPVVGSFSGHAGYDGVMLGLPGVDYHLELTRHEAGSPGPAPTRDNLLVLYIPDEDAVARLARRLEGMGYPAVAPENPYWAERGVSVEDPDGWRVVLAHTAGIGPQGG